MKISIENDDRIDHYVWTLKDVAKLIENSEYESIEEFYETLKGELDEILSAIRFDEC